MVGNHRSPGLGWLLLLGAAACGSTTMQGTGDGGVAAAPDAGQSEASASEDTGSQAPDTGAPDEAAADGTSLPGQDASTGDDGADAATVSEASTPTDASATPDAGDGSATSGSGQYSCTFNATGMYPLGGEHRGFNILGTVVDTTAGANKARVGSIQTALDTNDMIKFVWPNILTAGHTYDLALFEDFTKTRTCAGLATSNEAQWLFPIPAVTGDFTFNFTHNPRVASCQDFPTGPIP